MDIPIDQIRLHLYSQAVRRVFDPQRLKAYAAIKGARALLKAGEILFGTEPASADLDMTLDQATRDVAGRIYEVLSDDGTIGLSGECRAVIGYDPGKRIYLPLHFDIRKREVSPTSETPFDLIKYEPSTALKIARFKNYAADDGKDWARRYAASFLGRLLQVADETEDSVLEIGPFNDEGAVVSFAYRRYR